MFWNGIREGLRTHFKEALDMNSFMTWPEIVSTMVVKIPRYIFPAEQYLRTHNWERWSRVIDPELEPYSNENLISQAYHLARWENEMSRDVSDLERIVEIGGGYGAMALLIRRLGFTGEYVIYDFEELNTIQKYYLDKMGAEADLRHEFRSDEADLLIGLFSLSEMSPSVQANYLDSIATSHVLIGALNAPWEGVNTLPDLQARYPWAKLLPIEHMDGRIHLIG